MKVPGPIRQKNFRLTIEYDGTGYHGWQRQKEEPTIQAEIERVATRITGQPVSLTGSGRTDAGVHALGQVANFHCRTRLTPDELQRGLNSLLPGDIAIGRCEAVNDDFHARFDAIAKRYRYRILNQPVRSALERHRAWHLRASLDLAAMQAGSSRILGCHDFSAFEGAGSPRAHNVRRVSEAICRRGRSREICFEIEADGFLRYMVRNLVGTLVAVGRGQLTADDMAAILASRDRSRAAPTAPPQGLYLVGVQYGPNATSPAGQPDCMRPPAQTN
jgi:tRNA pseudouridine38-40 synthase